MSLKRHLAPGYVLECWDGSQALRRLGFSRRLAWQSALNSSTRDALHRCCVLYLPPTVRTRLHVVVDVGCNDGCWLAALKSVVWVGSAEVFEPNPDCFSILQRRFGTEPTVRLHNLGIADRPGCLELKVAGSSDFSSFLPIRQELAKEYRASAAYVDKTIVVSVDTLDNILHELPEIDLLKIDVQGFERQVLEGASQILKRTRTILIEMNLKSHYKGDETFGCLDQLLTRRHHFEFWDMSSPCRGRSGCALWVDAAYVNPVMKPSAGWYGNDTS